MASLRGSNMGSPSMSTTFSSAIRLIFCSSPNKIGKPIPSSNTICAAFKTLGLSASAKTIRLGLLLAFPPMALIT